MIVKDLYLESIRLEETSLAHYLHHLLETQKVILEDNISKLDFDQADHQIVENMIEKNVLGFHKVGVYSLKMNQNDYVFIFADSEQKAIQFYTESSHQAPLNCHEYPLDFELVRGYSIISFREMRKEFMNFPAVAGYFGKVDLIPNAVYNNKKGFFEKR